MRSKVSGIFAICWLVMGAVEAHGQTSTDELRRLSLQDLLSIEITTVSRQPEPTALAPAAVHVITGEDIRRSGAASIPEALRLAPGIQVARIDAGKWAIGMRGFADRLARSVLVLIDGRPVYSPLFAGTYWEVQDVFLQDVDRIEVIRGPGGTLWGANAVNGIINVITKRAADTQGLAVTGGPGTQQVAIAGLRYGGAARDGMFHYRAYGKGFAREHQFHTDDANYDDWRMAQGGFRGDWALNKQRSLTLQGDAYRTELGERATTAMYTPPFSETTAFNAPLTGANVLGRLTGVVGEVADFQLQASYEYTDRDEIPVSESRHTFDIDWQQTERRWTKHQLVWGAGYRVTADEIASTPPAAFVPGARTDDLFSAFLDDEITLVPDKLRGSIGTKIEHNDYSGFEIQPSGRLVWTPRPQQVIVWSITRAVRTPSRVETDYTTTSLVSANGPTFVRLRPNSTFQPEKLVAHELGYRIQPTPALYLTVSGFYNRLDDLLSTEVFPPFAESTPSPEHVVIPVQFANTLFGNSYGVEATADLRPAPWWRLTTNYSYLRISASREEGSRDGSQERRYEGLSPRHQMQLQSSFDLSPAVSVDWVLRYVSELPAGPIQAYATSNVRLGVRLTPQLELAVVGQDLHDPHHPEWPGSGGPAVESRRRGFVTMTWQQR